MDISYFKSKKFKEDLHELLETVIFVIVAVSLIRFFVAEVRWIPSGSMRPTLVEGDRIIVERFSRFYSDPQRGDIMVFYPPFVELKNGPVLLFKRLTGFFCNDIAYIKRVTALPGEKFEIKRALTRSISMINRWMSLISKANMNLHLAKTRVLIADLSLSLKIII